MPSYVYRIPPFRRIPPTNTNVKPIFKNWLLGATDVGVLTTTETNNPTTQIFLNDANGNSWQVDIGTSGSITTKSIAASGYPLVYILLTTPSGFTCNLSVLVSGILQTTVLFQNLAWEANQVVKGLPQPFARPEIVNPTMALPPYQFTVSAWSQAGYTDKGKPSPFAKPDIATPVKITTAPITPVAMNWGVDAPAEALANTFSRALPSAPDRAPDKISIASWESLKTATAVMNKFLPGDIFAPDKALPPYQFSVSAWESLRVATTVLNKFFKADVTVPDKALPAYQVTEAAWESLRIATSLDSVYALSDFIEPTQTTSVTPIVSSWEEEFKSGRITNFFTRAVPSALDKVPDQFSISAWETLRVSTALLNKFSRADVVGPDKALGQVSIVQLESLRTATALELAYALSDVTQPAQTTVVTSLLSGWLAETKLAALSNIFSRATPSAPDKALPPYQFTIAAWEALRVATAVLNKFSRADVVNPDKIFPQITVASWETLRTATAVLNTFMPGGVFAPEKLLPTITQPSWFALVAEALQLRRYLGEPTDQKAPIQPTITAPSIDAWSLLQMSKTVGSVFAKSQDQAVLPVSGVTIAGWQANIAVTLARANFIQTETGSLLTPQAVFTLMSWLQQLAQNKQISNYARVDALVEPDKTLPTLTIASWLHQYLASNAVKLPYSLGDVLTSPAKTLPPAVITLDNWLQYLAPNSLPKMYSPGDLLSKPDKTLPTVTANTIDSWLQYLADHGVDLRHAMGDTSTAPAKTLPPAVITLDNWFKEVAPNALPAKFIRAVNDEKVSPFAPISISSWYQEIASIAKRLTYTMVEGYTSPSLFPLQFVSLASWLEDVASKALVIPKAQAYGSVSPEKVIAPLLAAFQNLLAQISLGPKYQQSEAQAGPVFVKSVVTLNNWWQSLPPNQRLDLRYMFSQLTMPEKAQPPAAITLAQWLQYMAQDEVPPSYSRGDTYTAPTMVIPRIISSFVLKLAAAKAYPSLLAVSTYLYAALVAASAQVTPALDISSTNFYTAVNLQNLALRPTLRLSSINMGGNIMPLPTKLIPVRRNDQFLEIDGLQDAITQAYYSNATVTATLVDQYGDAVPGFNGILMSYIVGSNGSYRGLVEQLFNPPLGSGYVLQITASVPGGGGLDGTTDGYWELPAVVQPRTA